MDGQINVDYLASKYAQKIVKKTDGGNMKALENLATKTLAVLQEQGIYAMMLFLLSRTRDERKLSEVICESLCSMLERIPNFDYKPDTCKKENILAYYSSVTDDLDSLLLVRSLYVHTLIYTRYGAKAARIEYVSKNGGKK